MADYSISEAFQEIESYLMSSMLRNMSHHLGLEKAEGISYTQWQAEQLAALAEYRTANRQRFSGYFSRINTRIEEALRKAYDLGGMQQEAAILEALKKGWSGRRDNGSDKLAAQFFRINERKLNSYIKAVLKDMRSAETALLRMADDQYRKAIFNTGVAYNTGIYTLPQAIDAATKDYLSRGIACIEYKNGARVLIDTYAEMALRTSATRCYLQGESAKRDEWGVNTVIVNRRGSACPKCLQYVGKVFYDDVYGNLPVPDGRYPRLSSAIAGGLYHPNCKDIHTTYFEGISEPPRPLTEDEERKASEVYRLEQQQRYNERQIRKYSRLAEYTLDPEQKQRYSERLKQWEKVNAKFVEEHGDVLKRRYEREAIRDLTVRVEKPPTVHRLSENSNSPEKPLDKSVESGIIETGRYSYQKGVTKEVQAVFDEEYELAVNKYGSISTIRQVGILNDNSTDWGTFNDNGGILQIRNANKKDCLSTLANRAIVLHKSGEWSTANAHHVFRHEIAHAIQLEHRLNDPLWDDKLRRISEIYKKAYNSEDGYSLPSAYSQKYIDEFISECIAACYSKSTRNKAVNEVVRVIGGD